MEVKVMANIKKAPGDQKDDRVTVRLTNREKEEIKKEASKNHMNISEYMLAKSTQEGSLSVRKESNRIIKLTSVEDALMVLREKIKNMNPNADVLEALDNVDKEIIKLWRC